MPADSYEPSEKKETRMSDTVISLRPPSDGQEWDCQCARCGSSLGFDLCEECGGDGWIEDDTDAINGPEKDVCNLCAGRCSWSRCLSSADWCQANPRPGREAIEPSMPEWFVVRRSGVGR